MVESSKAHDHGFRTARRDGLDSHTLEHGMKLEVDCRLVIIVVHHDAEVGTHGHGLFMLVLDNGLDGFSLEVLLNVDGDLRIAVELQDLDIRLIVGDKDHIKGEESIGTLREVVEVKASLGLVIQV